MFRLVMPVRVRNLRVLDTDFRIVNPVQRTFFGFGDINVLDHTVMMSDREGTAPDCIDGPGLAAAWEKPRPDLPTAPRGALPVRRQQTRRGAPGTFQDHRFGSDAGCFKKSVLAFRHTVLGGRHDKAMAAMPRQTRR